MTSSHLTPRWRNSKPCESGSRNPHSVASCSSLSTVSVRVCACMRCLCGWEICGSKCCPCRCVSPPKHSKFLTSALPVTHRSPPALRSPSSYMVMPFVAQDLGHIMKRRRLTDRIIVYLFYQLLRGLKVSLCPLFSILIWYNTVFMQHPQVRVLHSSASDRTW